MIQDATKAVQARWQGKPRVGIILGTGLGGLAEEIKAEAVFPYKDIPHFPVSTVESHASRLVCGKLAGKTVMAMEGRFHAYEGYSLKQITFPHGTLNDLEFSPDEQLLAIASKDLGIYSVGESNVPRLLRSDDANYGNAQFSRDGQSLLVTTGNSVIETIDVYSGALRFEVCCSSIYGAAVFTPDGQTIANAGHWPRLWDARSGQLIGEFTENREFETFGPIAFDAGRDEILMGSQDGRVYAWDLKTRRPTAVSPAQASYVETVAVSTSGWVIFAGFGNSVQLWKRQTGQHRSLPTVRPTSNLVIGHDGSSIIFGTAEGSIEFWDVTTEQRLRSIKIPGA